MNSPSREPLAGRYELQERIAVGGQGEVWKAWDPRIRRTVAVKFLHAHLISGHGRERFRREAEALGRLRHPAVVQLYDVVETDEALALVMEFVPGSPLSELLPPEGLDWPTCVRIGTVLAAALNSAHREGVVHRDLKPGNVLIEPDGAVRLTDFGLARLVGEGKLSQTGAAMGTPGYWAPEQVLGLPITAQTDVYGLAALLYRSATGVEPLPAAAGDTGSPFEQVMMKIRDAGDLRGDLSPAAVEVLRRGLEKDARDRYPDAESLGQQLRGTLPGPVPTEATTLVGRMPGAAAAESESGEGTVVADGQTAALERPARSRRPLVVAGALGVAIVAGAAALGAVMSPGEVGPAPSTGVSLTTQTGVVGLPPGWTRRAALPTSGLALADGVAGEPTVGNTGVTLVMGLMETRPPRLFPLKFGERLWPSQVRPSTEDRVLLGEHPALRFRDLKLDNQGARRATLFVIPTNRGSLAIACLSPSAESSTGQHVACEGAARSVKLRGGVRATGVGPDEKTGALIQSALDDVVQERNTLYASLASTYGGFSQERLLAPASKRIEAAGNRLIAAAGSDPAEAARLKELGDAIRNYAGHLRRAGDFARAGAIGTRDSRAEAAATAEQQIFDQIQRLRELGYTLEDGEAFEPTAAAPPPAAAPSPQPVAAPRSSAPRRSSPAVRPSTPTPTPAPTVTTPTTGDEEPVDPTAPPVDDGSGTPSEPTPSGPEPSPDPTSEPDPGTGTPPADPVVSEPSTPVSGGSEPTPPPTVPEPPATGEGDDPTGG